MKKIKEQLTDLLKSKGIEDVELENKIMRIFNVDPHCNLSDNYCHFDFKCLNKKSCEYYID